MDVARLRAAFPSGSFVDDPDVLARYSQDVTGRFRGTPVAVVRPRSVGGVAEVLSVCNRESIGVVPQGGNTGLVGGAIASDGQIVLSLEHLVDVTEVDRGSASLVAGAGATLQAVQERAGAAGLELPIDFAARASATVGGMVATDAGGRLALRYGTMRDRLLGLQVVLADGTIVDHLDRPAGETGGFDLVQLIPGSEGTLGIVTAARLSVVTPPARRTVALVAATRLEDAATVATRLRRDPRVEALDFFLEKGLALVTAHAGLAAPFSRTHAAYLVVSCTTAVDELGTILHGSPEAVDVAVAQSAQQAKTLWSYRELHNAAINAAGVPVKLDVRVPTELVPELTERVDAWLERERPQATAYYYGHLGAGNVHVNVLGTAGDDASTEEAILRIVAGMGGDVAAEHGIGQAKNRWLHLTRSKEEIDAMRRLKAALDPAGILNPGKLLPPGRDA